MIHNSRATVYSSGFFTSVSYLPRQARQNLRAKYSIPSRKASVFEQSMRVDLPEVKTVVVPSYRLHLNTEGGINSESFLYNERE
jgi:hypothetical protein